MKVEQNILLKQSYFLHRCARGNKSCKVHLAVMAPSLSIANQTKQHQSLPPWRSSVSSAKRNIKIWRT